MFSNNRRGKGVFVMGSSERFWNATHEELKQGFIEQDKEYICLLCGKKIEKGIIYPVDNCLYEASRYIEKHIEQVHYSVFDYLISLDKKLTGLTDHQNNLLKLFYQGKGDQEIQKELGIGSSSTIRNHRFVLKEKERQAKVFLALMDLLKERDEHAPAIVEIHKNAKMIDDRYRVTKTENEEVLRKYFKDGKLTTFSMKEKNKIIVLREIIKQFDPNKVYSEKEVNIVLGNLFEDFVTLRRYLIEYGFFDRHSDGSQYWLKK